MVALDQDCITRLQVNALFQPFCIGHEQVVPYQLDAVSQLFCEHFPAVPILFLKPVFNGADWETVHQPPVVFHHLVCAAPYLPARHLALAREQVHAGGFIVKLTGRSINGNLHVRTRLQAVLLHGLYKVAKYLLGILKVRCKASLIADACAVSVFF